MRKLWGSGLLSLLFLFWACLPVWADAPVEEYYFERSSLFQRIPADCKGALAVSCVDAPSMKKFHNQVVPEVTVTLYERSQSGFLKTRTVNIVETRPLSGYLFNGICFRRFPTVDRDRDFVNIVYDVEKGLRAWVKLDDLSGLLPKAWSESVFLTWFDEGRFKKHDCIDIFGLRPDTGRRLYDEPCETSRSRLIQSYDDIGDSAPNPVVVDYRNGFVRLGFFDSCEGTIRKSKWIRVRDKKGRLTIWPHICLSC
ncbi:MAG: hypothetical protein V1792_11225 [Pseudomonadota bacterium]